MKPSTKLEKAITKYLALAKSYKTLKKKLSKIEIELENYDNIITTLMVEHRKNSGTTCANDETFEKFQTLKDETKKENDNIIEKINNSHHDPITIEILKYVAERAYKLDKLAISEFTRKYKNLTKQKITNQEFRDIFKDFFEFGRNCITKIKLEAI